MQLADFITANKERVIERWKCMVVERLSLATEDSHLVNHLPVFLDELAEAAREPFRRWPDLSGARDHGRHRMRMGVDPGGLTAEMAMVGEALLLVAEEVGHELSGADARLISRIIGHGTAASINAYAAMRDKQLAEQATRHFSFIAHEIRNPLHNAKLAAAAMKLGSERGAERLDRALSQLSELIDNSLVQARMFGQPTLHAETHDVLDLLHAAREDVVAPAEDRGQTIDIEAESFTIEADRKLLISALVNLLKNAVKFTHDGGRIELRARTVDGRALFEVEDECGGIPEGLTERMFQPFVQAGLDKSGFGLGLAIVKQVVNAHQGAVRVVNHPDKGCTIVLELPLQQPKPDS
jgi:signal transduction histidine kinase